MITLKADRKQHDNAIRLTWRNSDSNDCTYKIFRRRVSNTLDTNVGKDSFTTISTVDFDNEDTIKVLNIHPNCGNEVQFRDFLGESRTIKESEVLQKWLLEAREDAPKGYGLGIIDITSCPISSFNENPLEQLFSDGVAKYDVVCVGFFDNANSSNKNEQFTTRSRDVLRKYINAGYGVLIGHDYISGLFGIGANLGPLRDLFNVQVGYWNSNSNMGYDNNIMSRYAGNKLKICKSDSIMSYPWFIGVAGDEIDIAYTHTTSQFANGDIWLSFANPDSSGEEFMTEVQKKKANCYLTTYKSTAMIQIGNTLDIKDVERKILANTIVAIKQITSRTTFYENKGIDNERPSTPKIHNHYIDKKDFYATFDYESEDIGVKVEYYVEATYKDSGVKEVSNIISSSFTSGLKCYKYKLQRIASDTPESRSNQWVETTTKVLVTDVLDKGYYSFQVFSLDENNNKSDIKEVVFYMPGEVKREKSSAVTKYPNAQRINHRYRGPHESRKANDVIAQVKFNIKNLRSIVDDLDKEKEVLLERPNVDYVSINENKDIVLDRIRVIRKNRLRPVLPRTSSVVRLKAILLEKRNINLTIK